MDNLPRTFTKKMNALPIELFKKIHLMTMRRVKFVDMDSRMMSQIKPESP